MTPKSRDPYVYPGTHVLINKEDIRDAAELNQFERIMSGQRLSEGLPDISLTPKDYCSLHHHLFQDVYAWAGKRRTVDIAKGNDMFCLAAHVERELAHRMAAIRAEKGLRGLGAAQFAERLAEHVSELNAIHTFREGNGRTQRAFMVVLGRLAGHRIEIQRIDPDRWMEASKASFRTGETKLMRKVIANLIASRAG
jgi:cell filamentation protein